MSGKSKALFLDRDGVVNADSGYVHRPEQVVFIDGIFELCRAAGDAGWAVAIVTNQAGIARGYYSEQDFERLTAWMGEQFKERGAPVPTVYHCPHHPEHGIGAMKQACFCRKPQPGMLERAARELSLDLSGSLMVGDKMSDIEAARRAGVGTRVLLAETRGDELLATEFALASLDEVRHRFFGSGRTQPEND